MYKFRIAVILILIIAILGQIGFAQGGTVFSQYSACAGSIDAGGDTGRDEGGNPSEINNSTAPAAAVPEEEPEEEPENAQPQSTTPGSVSYDPGEPVASTTGAGLKAQYYGHKDLTNLRLTRLDGTVAFNWGSGSPDAAIEPDTYSVRWTGQVQAKYEEEYTFYTQSDDGVRLWIDGLLLIDRWTDHSLTECSGKIHLNENQKYDIAMEYYENKGVSAAKLLWSSASQPKEVIPQIRLYPAEISGIPENPSAVSTTHSSVTFTWDAIGDASEYEVEADGTVYGAAENIFIHEGLPPNTPHTYRVRALTDTVTYGWSEAVAAYTLPETGKGTGLKGQYYNGREYTDLKLTRIDPSVHYSWEDGSPAPMIAENDFAIRWTGQIEAFYSEEYAFHVQSDDGARLWVNGELIIDDWKDHSLKENTGRILLQAGQKYDIKLEYYENKGVSAVKLMWSSESQEKEIIPTSQLFPADFPGAPENVNAVPAKNSIALSWDAVGDAVEYEIEADGEIYVSNQPQYIHEGLLPSTAHNYRIRAVRAEGPCRWSAAYTFYTLPEGNGTGLRAGYYNSKDLTNQALIRQDSTVDFSWGSGSPAAEVNKDGFSAEWTGWVEAVYSEEYTFHTYSDDGVRLWIDDNLVIDDWTDHSVKENTAKLQMVSGHKYKIRMAYYENKGSAVARLLWSRAGQTKEVIPSAHLYSDMYENSPVNLAGQASTTTITLTWDAVEGASGYDVEMDGEVFDSFETRVHIFDELEQQSTHVFRVRAVIDGVEWNWSRPVEVTTLPYDTDSWIQRASLPTADMCVGAAVSDGAVYAVCVNEGPEDDNGEASPDTVTVYEYKDHEDRWEWRSASTADYETYKAVGLNGKIYLVTIKEGMGENIFTALVYDPANDVWSERSSFVVSYHDNDFELTCFQGKIFALVFYSDNEMPFTYILEYNPATDVWTKRARMPELYIHSGLSPLNDSLFATGGMVYWDQAYDFVVVYDPDTDIWTEGPALPENRGAHSTTELDGNLYNIGGFDVRFDDENDDENYDYDDENDENGDDGYENDEDDSVVINVKNIVEKYDGATGEWAARSQKPADWIYSPAAVLNGRILCLGSWTVNDVYKSERYYYYYDRVHSNCVYEYDPGTHIFGAPKNLSGTVNTTSVSLTWDPVAGAESYDVEADGVIYGDISANGYIHSGLSNETQHTYRVRAHKESTEGEWSAPITKTTRNIIAGKITEDTVWRAEDGPYYIKENITIEENAKLQIMPGTQIIFYPGVTIYAKGAIDAAGTGDSRIVLTSLRDDDFGGNGIIRCSDPWNIQIAPQGEFKGEYLDIRYGNINAEGPVLLEESAVSGQITICGEANIFNNSIDSYECRDEYEFEYDDEYEDIYHFEGGELVISNMAGDVSVKNNSVYRIYIEQFGYGDLSVENNIIGEGSIDINLNGLSHSIFDKFTGNIMPDTIVLSAQDIGSWDNSGIIADLILSGEGTFDNTYLIEDNIIIPSGRKLTIQPGIILKSASSRYSLEISGVLDAIGTDDEPIVFTSESDEIYGGSGDKTYWGGIRVKDTGVFTGEHIKIRYGGRYYVLENYYHGSYMALLVEGILNLTYSEISYSSQIGILFNTINQSVLTNNKFFANGTYAVYDNRYTIDAKNNYWGSLFGPIVENHGYGWDPGIHDYEIISWGINYSPYLGEDYKSQVHFGETGIYSPSGNFCRSYTDMSLSSPGFEVNISRTYNSLDSRDGSMLGKGWTFGFESYIRDTDSYSGTKSVKLPNGGVQAFKINSDGTFTAVDSRSRLEKNADGSYVLTTKDQYTYGFNSNGHLTWMKDRNANAVSANVDATGKILEITDSVGRAFHITYNSSGRIDMIQDVSGGRTVRYIYQDDQLVKAIDPDGRVTNYEYNLQGRLTAVKDHYGKPVESITYITEEEDRDKVSSITDIYGNTRTYAYNRTNRRTTITDSQGRETVQWYDPQMNITSTRDPEGFMSSVEYFRDSHGICKYGEEKTVTDRYGNKTQYERDSEGNITAIINPDLSRKEMAYDSRNNLISERDEDGKYTFYVYDAGEINLLKKIQPLNGTDLYTEGCGENAFAITEYAYFTEGESQGSGLQAKGLLKSVRDPEGGITSYTYDGHGNAETVLDPETGKVTAYEYNNIGLVTAVVTPEGYRTEYTYSLGGALEKQALAGGETTRTVYDDMGRIIKKISPNLYDPDKDDLAHHLYNDDCGTRYTYYDSGKVKTLTDAEDYTTSYVYDMYGNIAAETKPNGSRYRNVYDVMNRLVGVYFKSSAGSQEVLLEQYEYIKLSDGKTRKNLIRRLSDNETATAAVTYDFAGREISRTNPDGTGTSAEYNANGTVKSTTDARGSATYFLYDGQNRLSQQWTPLENGGAILYSYKKITYDKTGRQKLAQSGKGPVSLYGLPSAFAATAYEYYKNGKIKAVTDSEGRKKEYRYDGDGNISEELVYTENDKYIKTVYGFNHLNKPVSQTVFARKGDIWGNSFDSEEEAPVTTLYTYDGNGNRKTVTTPDGVTATYFFDRLDRQTGTSMPGLDETGAPAEITRTSQLNWEGKPLISTDANGNATAYTYDARGFLEKVTDAEGGTAAYRYDLAGRKTAEVAPKDYDDTKTLDQMNRILYTYDQMDRLKTKAYAGEEEVLDPDTLQWVARQVNIVQKAYKYDGNGNVIKELDAGGYEAGTGTDADSRIDSGYGTEYEYNLANQAVSVLDPISKQRNLPYTLKYSYDAMGRKISETNANGVETKYYYDDAGNVLSVRVKRMPESPEEAIQTNAYDLVGNALSSADANGNTTRYEYNKLGKIRKIVYPGDASIPENIVTYQYDEMGNPKRQQSSVGAIEAFGYDNQGRVLHHTREKADGTQSISTSARYDKNGNRRFETDGNGVGHETAYDALNRMIRSEVTISGIPQTVSYGYDANGNQTAVTDWLGNTVTNIYDSLNRLIETRDAFGTSVQKLEYDLNNAQTGSYDALGNKTQYIYDRNNRLLTTISPENRAVSQTYDNVGNIETKTDGRGNATVYTYDELSRLAGVKNALEEITRYAYDANGNMLEQTDGKGNTISYEYNAMNKVARKIDPGGRTGAPGSYAYEPSKVESCTYDADGSLKTKTDRNGNTAHYTYDVHGRPLNQTINENAISYTYDGAGNQLTMTDSTGATVRTYDELGRVLTKDVPDIGASIFQYDIIEGVEAGCVKETATDPKGGTTAKVYDKAGRLREVTADGKTTVYGYYDNGGRQSVTYDDGSCEEYIYYSDNLLWTLTNKKGDGSEMERYAYEYDAAGNQTSKHEIINGAVRGTTAYTYDALNRLLTVTEPESARITAYTYDAAGNRETETVSSTTGAGVAIAVNTYSYDSQNRLTGTVAETDGEIAAVTEYGYDGNGNRTSAIVNGVVTEIHTYDEYNRLIGTETGGRTMTYTYNGEGMRVGKAVDGDLTRYLYEGDKVILETDAGGERKARNVYGLNLLMRSADNESYYFMYNGHGDVTVLLNIDGTTGAAYYYDAFGNILEESGDADNPIRYAGYQYDEETGLYYLNARYYDSRIARFLSEDTYTGDPNDPLSLNLYTYCHNEPIMYWDPTGHWEQGDEYLNDEAKARIIAITNAYYEATTAAEREAIHNQAVTIRNDQSSYRPKVTPLTIEAHGAITNAVNQGVAARGYMTKDEWVNAINSDGITYTTDISYDVSSIGVKKDSNTVTSIGRTDIGVNVNSNLISQTASASTSLTYNLSHNEAKFVNSAISNYDYSLEQSICLLDVLEMNDGEIADSNLQSIVGDNYYTPDKWYEKLFGGLSTADMLELEYSTTHFGYTTAEIDYMMTQERLSQAYNLMCFQALCAASNASVSIGPRDAGYYYVNGQKVYYESPSGYLFESGAKFAPHGSATAYSTLYPAISITGNGTSIHKNSNAYVGNQAVYEITKDGGTYKFGKADNTNLASSGFPVRLQTQINKLIRMYPNSVIGGRLVYSNQSISTADIKAVETSFVQTYYNKFGMTPVGNPNHRGLIP